MLSTFIDRFDLIHWFLGDREHPSYDASQQTFMVEELLNLLIICACERASVAGLSVEDRIKREIIHHVCLGPIEHASLIKHIPDRLHEHPAFERILAEVADLRAPTGFNDVGVYRIKPEYYRDVDPFFWHYSRNNREEAFNVLQEEHKKRHPEETFFLIPKSSKLSGPFQYLGQYLQSPVFTQMMAYVLWNVRLTDDHKSDTSLDQALYLILLALVDENHKPLDEEAAQGFKSHICGHYFAFTSDDHSQDLSLFDILTIFRGDEQYKSLYPQLDWIFERLVTEGPGLTQRKVQKWKETRAADEEQRASNTLSAAEKRKQAIKKHQQQIMAQFAQAQTLFMEQNEDLYEEEEEAEAMRESQDGETQEAATSADRFYDYPTGACIVCQEDANEKSAPYGLLGLIQSSNILREVPRGDQAIYDTISRIHGTLDADIPRDDGTTHDIKGFPSSLSKIGLYTSTCGHLMHIECFSVYCSSVDSRQAQQLTRNHPENRARSEFMCPLCKSLGNTLLPVIWRGRKETSPGSAVEQDDAKFRDFLRFSVKSGLLRLKYAAIPRLAAGQRRRSSGASKLKEAISTWVPTLRSTPSAGSSANGGSSSSSSSSSSGGSGLFPAPEEWSASSRLSGFVNAGDARSRSSAELGRGAGLPVPSYLERDRWFGPFDADIIYPTAHANLATISKTYTQLTEVLSALHAEICKDDKERQVSMDAKNIDMLWSMVGYTIAAVEIATRGQAQPEDGETGTLIDQIPAQMQTLLRVLCDTVLAYTCIMCHNEPQQFFSQKNSTLLHIHMLALGRLHQVFIDKPLIGASASDFERMVLYPPLLQDDPFMVFAESTFHGIPFAKLDMDGVLRTLLLAEVTRTAVGLLETPEQYQTQSEEREEIESVLYPAADVAAVQEFMRFIMAILECKEKEHGMDPRKLYNLIRTYTLPFLRRSLILVMVRCGYVPCKANPQDDRPEFDRLLTHLRLPEFSHLITLSLEMKQLVATWCLEHAHECERQRNREQQQQQEQYNELNEPVIRLDLPTPFELIPLPERLDQLVDESMRRICQKCGMVPTDPALCLLCGTFVCAQSYCCAEDEYGECNLHALE